VTGSDGRRRPAAGSGAVDGEPSFGETWVYESLVSGIPGLQLTARQAVSVQVVLFETLVLGLGLGYGLSERAVVAGTAAVVVAAAGSVAMLRIGAAARGVGLPAAHHRLLFGSSVEVLFGVLSFVALTTYLLGGAAPTPLATLLGAGGAPPGPVVFVALLLLWDLCYRTGTSWWTALVSLWRSLRYRVDAETARRCRRIDAATVGFALLELALVPVVWRDTLLVGAIVGHVVAVTAVSTAATVLLGRNE
jgi:hypothetical protein